MSADPSNHVIRRARPPRNIRIPRWLQDYNFDASALLRARQEVPAPAPAPVVVAEAPLPVEVVVVAAVEEIEKVVSEMEEAEEAVINEPERVEEEGGVQEPEEAEGEEDAEESSSSEEEEEEDTEESSSSSEEEEDAMDLEEEAVAWKPEFPWEKDTREMTDEEKMDYMLDIPTGVENQVDHWVSISKISFSKEFQAKADKRSRRYR